MSTCLLYTSLVAEDNDLNMEIVEYMLERNGIQVVCAKDGQEAVSYTHLDVYKRQVHIRVQLKG